MEPLSNDHVPGRPRNRGLDLNGPLLDGISYVTGLKSGRYLIRQNKRDDQQVPKFRDDMTAPEIAAMIETLFRVRGGTVEFKTLCTRSRGRSSGRQRLSDRL